MTVATNARDITMDELAGFSSDDEGRMQKPWRESPRIVGTRKRDHAQISQSSIVRTQTISSQKQATGTKKARVNSRSSALPPAAVAAERISPRAHTSSNIQRASTNIAARRSRSIVSSRTKHLHLTHHDGPQSPRSMNAFSLSPERPHGPSLVTATAMALTNAVVTSSSEGIARRPDLRHRGSMGESTATTTSTGGNNNNNNNRCLPSTTNTTGTTGTTEVISNVHRKRRADFGGEESQSMLFDDDRLESRSESSRGASSISKKTRRRSPASLHSSFNRRSFLMDVDNPFFALLEVIRPSSSRDDHRLAILQPQIRSEVDAVPQAARMLELPAEALHGVWAAELKRTSYDGTPSSTIHDSMSPEEITSLGSSTLSLRHHSRAGLSHLRNYHTRYCSTNRYGALFPPPSASTAVASATTGPMDPETLNVSFIHPRWTRQTQMDSQRVAAAVEHNHHEHLSAASPSKAQSKCETSTSDGGFFIAGVSVVGFPGFTCSGDLNTNASKVSSTILEGIEDARTTAKSREQSAKDITCPSLLGVAGATRPIGVSVLCELEMSSDYVVWIGQDLTKKGSPIVAIDVTFSDPSTSVMTQTDSSGKVLSTSPTSSMSAKDSTGDDEDGPLQELSELNLRAHTQSVGKTEYDPFQRLWSRHHSKSEVRTSDQVRPNYNESYQRKLQNNVSRHEAMRLPLRGGGGVADDVPVVTDTEIIPSSTPDSMRATHQEIPQIASNSGHNFQLPERAKDDCGNRNTDTSRIGPEQVLASATDPTDVHVGLPQVGPTVKRFVSNRPTQLESTDSLSLLHRTAVTNQPISSSSRLAIPRILENPHNSGRRLAFRRGAQEQQSGGKSGTSKGREDGTATAVIPRNGSGTKTNIFIMNGGAPATLPMQNNETLSSTHRRTARDRGDLKNRSGFSRSSDGAVNFHATFVRANQAAKQRPVEAKSVADFLREQLHRSNSPGKTFRIQNARRVANHSLSVNTTGIGQNLSSFRAGSCSGEALRTRSLTQAGGTSVMAREDTETPSTSRRLGRHSGTFSSLRLLVFAAWSLLTWTTTPVPTVSTDLLSRESMSLTEVSFRPTLVWKPDMPHISTFISGEKFIPGENGWPLEGNGMIAGGLN